MKHFFNKKKTKKTYLKNIRRRNRTVLHYLLTILLLVAIFLSPVFYDSTKSNASFIKNLETYLININNNMKVIFDEVVTDFLPPVQNYTGLTVHYIDVGQGDAALVQVNGKNMLIDTGAEENKDKLFAYLDKRKIKKIDILLLTHPHADHMGAAASLLDNYEVAKIYMTDYIHTTESYKNLLLKIKEKGLKITEAKKGVTIDLGNDVSALILSPGKVYSDINASSVVLKLTYGKNAFLFSGDATKETEHDIIEDAKSRNSLKDLKVDVYKVAHHGSNSSNSSEFLNVIRPELSVISVGKENVYGHPHKSVLKRLKKIHSIILTTKDEGTIQVFSDGNHISYELENGNLVKLY